MKQFLRNQSVAATTDWVVLAFVLVGLTAAVLSLISTGSLDLAPGMAKSSPASG